MIVSRRALLQGFSGLTLSSASLPFPQGLTGAAAGTDEAFWQGIRARFELRPDRINLVTVVRGVTTQANRDLVAQAAATMNAFRAMSPDPDWRTGVARKVATFIGASPPEVALVRNTTEGVTTVLMNWPLERGDEILTSSTEHGAFYDTLAQRAHRDGIGVRQFHYPAPPDSPGAIVAAVDAAMTPRTKLVMIGHVVLTGLITPVRAIADLVHRRGARLLVDGVLGIGHVPVDVTAMDCDFYAAGFHKWGCGPRATAGFYVRPELVARLPPLFGAMDETPEGQPRPLWNAPVVTKYERTGAHPAPHLFALGEAIDFLSEIGVRRIQERLFMLTARWLTRARRVKGFRSPVAPEPWQCAGLAAWEIEGRENAAVRQVLTERNLLVGGTESYAGFFGIPAAKPRSLFIANAGIFTSLAEVDALADAIESLGA